jgi:hypothetical protein
MTSLMIIHCTKRTQLLLASKLVKCLNFRLTTWRLMLLFLRVIQLTMWIQAEANRRRSLNITKWHHLTPEIYFRVWNFEIIKWSTLQLKSETITWVNRKLIRSLKRNYSRHNKWILKRSQITIIFKMFNQRIGLAFQHLRRLTFITWNQRPYIRRVKTLAKTTALGKVQT